MDLDRIVEEIESRLDIATVVGRYVKLRKAGRNHVGLCPFHPEKTPSFTVSPDKGFFYCFGCKAGGNVVHFLSKIEGLSYMEALKTLADEVGIEVDFVKKPKSSVDEYELMSRVSEYFSSQLQVNNRAKEYLKSRGIDEELSNRFRLGYSPASGSYLPKFLKDVDYSFELAEKLGVLGRSKDGSFYGYMRDRVIFPILDMRGRVVAFGGRTMGDENPKYLNSPATPIFDKSKTLFGINIAKREIQLKKRVIVSEGYMDVISMHKVGFSETVSTLGTAFTDLHAKIIRRFTHNVHLFFDSDSAGKNATIGAIKACLTQGLDCFVIQNPTGKDPDDLARGGKEAVDDVIKNSLESVDFVIKYFSGLETDPNLASAKSRIAKQSWEVVSATPDPIIREEYLEKLAKTINVPKAAISSFIKRKPKVNLKTSDARTSYERRIVSVMCKDQDVSKQVLDVATSDYFRSGIFREIFELIKKVDGKVSELQKSLNGGAFDDELSSVIAGMMVDESINEDEKLFVSQVLNDITRYSLEMLRKKYDNQGLTSEEFELYQRLQREIRGRKNREKDKTEKSEERRSFRRESGEEKDRKEDFDKDFRENQFGGTRAEEELEIDEDEDVIFY